MHYQRKIRISIFNARTQNFLLTKIYEPRHIEPAGHLDAGKSLGLGHPQNLEKADMQPPD